MGLRLSVRRHHRRTVPCAVVRRGRHYHVHITIFVIELVILFFVIIAGHHHQPEPHHRLPAGGGRLGRVPGQAGRHSDSVPVRPATRTRTVTRTVTSFEMILISSSSPS